MQSLQEDSLVSSKMQLLQEDSLVSGKVQSLRELLQIADLIGCHLSALKCQHDIGRPAVLLAGPGGARVFDTPNSGKALTALFF